MRARTRASVLPLQSSSSLILASISREGDSPLVVALFFILFAPHSAVFPSCEGTNRQSTALSPRDMTSSPAPSSTRFILPLSADAYAMQLCKQRELCRQTSVCPRQGLLQGRKELLPPALGAAVGLLLIRPEA